MRSVDVPQFDSLDKLRPLLEAVEAAGDMCVATGLSKRHVDYAVHAARILGLLAADIEGSPVVTDRGRQLLATAPGSANERAVLRVAAQNSRAVAAVAPSLFAPVGPDPDRLAEVIEARARLRPATAHRRAATLLRWRVLLMEEGRQAALFELGKLDPPAVASPGTSGRTRGHAAAAETHHRREPPRSGDLRLTRVQIVDYGPIRNVDVRIQSFQVLIGANATGKSSFLDALKFLADALGNGIEAAWRRRARRFNELVWQGRADRFSVAVEVYAGGTTDWPVARYELSVGRLHEDGVGVLHEALYLVPSSAESGPIVATKRPRGWKSILTRGAERAATYHAEVGNWKTPFHLGADRLALAFVQDDVKRFPVAIAVRNFLKDGWVSLALSGEKLREECSPDLSRRLRDDGENLPLVLQGLLARAPHVYKRWVAQVREALPEIRDVRVRSREDTMDLHLIVEYRNGLRLPSWRLSDGTLRILALILLGYLEDDAVYLIEEPENGIHPQAIEAVYEALSTSSSAQFLVATHSPVFLGVVPPEQLLCFHHDGQETFVQSGQDHPRLRGYAKDVDLPTLFATGLL